MPDVFTTLYKPDVLSCLADLSNDEVFTPPSVVNDMLDMLPQKLFESPDTTFLDPVCKSGVFLREIAKRLIKGLEDKIPDLQERVDHIFQKTTVRHCHNGTDEPALSQKRVLLKVSKQQIFRISI